MKNELDSYRGVMELNSDWDLIPSGLQEYMLNPRQLQVTEMEAIFSNFLIKKLEEAKQEDESERDKATSEAVF